MTRAVEVEDVSEEMASTLSPGALDDREAELVELRLPATVDSLPVLRSVASTITIRADFDVDRIEDTRLLTDELCSTLIRSAQRSTTMRSYFRLGEQALHIMASVPVQGPTEPDRQRFSWRVLETLADTAQTWSEPVPAAEHEAAGQWRLHIETSIERSRSR